MTRMTYTTFSLRQTGPRQLLFDIHAIQTTWTRTPTSFPSFFTLLDLLFEGNPRMAICDSRYQCISTVFLGTHANLTFSTRKPTLFPSCHHVAWCVVLARNPTNGHLHYSMAMRPISFIFPFFLHFAWFVLRGNLTSGNLRYSMTMSSTRESLTCTVRFVVVTRVMAIDSDLNVQTKHGQ